LFLSEVGYRPSFISVINDDNSYNAIDNVLLAKKMDVECKLNYAMASGVQSKPFVLSKIYEIYIQIYKMGLAPWEFNTKQMLKRMIKAPTICPQNRGCDSNIRCLQPAGDYYSCGAFGDDQSYSIDFSEEVINSGKTQSPLADAPELFSLKDECFSCPMFEICNGCKKTINDLKLHNLVEDHCTRMKSIAHDIIELQSQTYESVESIKDPGFTFAY
jgi:radical SAM protein with 4Fe4S-binding SPASM domain